ncbi:HipA N-terminal domain-containing protein [Corynebacterium variabile]|uniref:HipA N-terminal domain-containing protein n=1 Tax=Corynebacterium variabile TaxID=1727 RepID=UPI003FD0C3DC
MKSRTSTLDVYSSGANLGALSQEAGGRHWFTYRPDYSGPALSLSMPSTTRRWGPDRVEPFIAGLVPDDSLVREHLAREHDVVGGNPFSLLSVIGQDCAGAVQFLAPGKTPDTFSELRPVAEADITARLTRITGPSAGNWLAGREHWSLAGMQAKIALHQDPGSGRWFETLGSALTTHIIKPAGPLPQHAVNEVLCLRALSELGIPTAQTDLHMFGDIPSVVSTRWDRTTGVTSSSVVYL